MAPLRNSQNSIGGDFFKSALTALVITCGLFFSSCVQFTPSVRVATSLQIEHQGIHWADSDSDGIPDPIELTTSSDRENFRKWFAMIAELQFYNESNQWNIEQRDCAGLVRFAMREALRRHDRAWFSRMGAEYSSVAPDVRKFSLEKSPVGEKLFRTNDNSFILDDLDNGSFNEFADAQSLRSYNSTFISRDRRQAKTGDLLFFNQPFAQEFPYHVMIYIGRSGSVSATEPDWVVYHTGNSPSDRGQVKKVALSVLDKHPDKKWRPLESNQNFLGFYRLKILD